MSESKYQIDSLTAIERLPEIKKENPDCLVLFRIGDFYQLFFDDAKIAAKTLGITLTSRDKASDNPIPMAGFPYHALENYLHKLVRSGYRIAIVEPKDQMAGRPRSANLHS